MSYKDNIENSQMQDYLKGEQKRKTLNFRKIEMKEIFFLKIRKLFLMKTKN